MELKISLFFALLLTTGTVLTQNLDYFISIDRPRIVEFGENDVEFKVDFGSNIVNVDPYCEISAPGYRKFK